MFDNISGPYILMAIGQLLIAIGIGWSIYDSHKKEKCDCGDSDG